MPPFVIPYRALLSKDTDGLLLAGTAAALAVQKETDARSVPLDKLPERLKQTGVPCDEPRRMLNLAPLG